MRHTAVDIHSGAAGDVVAISGHRVGAQERRGEILEVLGAPDRPHYRVRWDDGSETVLHPSSDAAIRRPRSGGATRKSP